MAAPRGADQRIDRLAPRVCPLLPPGLSADGLFGRGSGGSLWYDPLAPSGTAPGTIAVCDSYCSNHYGLDYTSLSSRPLEWNMLKQFKIDDARRVIFQKQTP